MLLNKHCRNALYPKSQVNRFHVPDELVSWKVPYAAYNPATYTAPHIAGQVWADADLAPNAYNFKPKWNQLDGKVNRISHTGNYHIEAGYPLNPIGRTGLRGRGLLGRWGPNHAADPIVTRWKRTINGDKVYDAANKNAILQMVAIQRHDNGMWAIPGGMVDPGELVSVTLKREFQEEALNSCAQGESAFMLNDFFAQGQEIYKGYVDDYRNTDNAWIETVAHNFHDDSGLTAGKLQLTAGDDAANVRWVDLSSTLKLHANHLDIVSKVVNNLNAYF